MPLLMVSTNTCTSRRNNGHAIISRKVSQYETNANRKYQRTPVMITSSENHLFANNGFRPDSCFRILPFSVTKIKVQQSRAHLLLQTRTKVLNDELEAVFRRWYPQFRTQAA